MFAVVTNIVLGFAVTSAVSAFGGGANGWRMVAIVFAIIALVVNTISVLAVKELPDEEVTVKEDGKSAEDKLSFLDTIKVLLKNKYYLMIVAIYIVYYIMSNLVTGSGVFFATYYLGNEGIYGLLNMMKMFPVIFALIIAPFIIKKVGNMQKVNTWAYGISCVLWHSTDLCCSNEKYHTFSHYSFRKRRICRIPQWLIECVYCRGQCLHNKNNWNSHGRNDVLLFFSRC